MNRKSIVNKERLLCQQTLTAQRISLLRFEQIQLCGKMDVKKRVNVFRMDGDRKSVING